MSTKNTNSGGRNVTEPRYSYLRIYEDYRMRILSGEIAEGMQLPTELEIQKIYGVSRITVKNAMELLRKDDLIERFPGKGTFVRQVKLTAQSAKPESPCVSRSHIIGVLVSSLYSSFGWKLLSGVASEANRLGYMLMVGVDYTTVTEEDTLIQRMRSNGVEGIIAVPVHSARETNSGILSCAAAHIPVVLADRYFDGIPIPYVCSDHLEGAYRAVEHLFQLGHTCIGLISSAPTTTAIWERERGYMRAYAMTPFQIQPKFLFSEIQSTMPGNNSPEAFAEDVARIKQYFLENPEVTAVLCIDYKIMRICKVAANELNLRIPEDISMVCFDAPDDSNGTYVQQAEREIGASAVKQLIRIMEAKETVSNVTVPTQLHVGYSTAKRKQDD